VSPDTKTYSFTLQLEGPSVFDPDVLEALIAAGCDDGLFGESGGVEKVDFERESAGTLAEAVIEAIAQVESAVPGLRVTRMDPEELVGVSDIAARVGRSRESVRLLAEGKRRSGGVPFPEPVARVGANRPLWHWSEVAAWFEYVLGAGSAVDRAPAVTRAVNAALDVRCAASRLSPAEVGAIASWLRPYVGTEEARPSPGAVSKRDHAEHAVEYPRSG
jgi:hypothetical protein